MGELNGGSLVRLVLVCGALALFGYRWGARRFVEYLDRAFGGEDAEQ